MSYPAPERTGEREQLMQSNSLPVSGMAAGRFVCLLLVNIYIIA